MALQAQRQKVKPAAPWSPDHNNGKKKISRMAGVQDSPDSHPAPLASTDELRTAWNHFRAGNAVLCPIDRAPIALSVDGSVGTYRFVCTQCGAASAWFESGPTGVRVRGPGTDPSPKET